MVYWHERQLLFVHIPKTGGTSVETILDLKKPEHGYGIVHGRAQQHFSWNDYHHLLGPELYGKYYKFAITRHPYTRIVSEYFWCEAAGLGARHGQTFDQFLTAVEQIVATGNYSQTVYHDHFIPQYQFVYDENGNLMVDKVFRLEEMNEVAKLVKLINGAELPHIQKSDKKELELTSEQKDKIYSIYVKDFELFSYNR